MALPGPPQRPTPFTVTSAEEDSSGENISHEEGGEEVEKQKQESSQTSSAICRASEQSCPRWSRRFQSRNANEGCQRGCSPQGWGVTLAVEEPDLQLQASGGGEEGRGKGGPEDQKVTSPPGVLALGGVDPVMAGYDVKEPVKVGELAIAK